MHDDMRGLVEMTDRERDEMRWTDWMHECRAEEEVAYREENEGWMDWMHGAGLAEEETRPIAKIDARNGWVGYMDARLVEEEGIMSGL